MEYKMLLDHSDDWLKYAILLNLFHETKDSLGEIRKTALTDERIQNYLSSVANFHGSLVTNDCPHKTQTRYGWFFYARICIPKIEGLGFWTEKKGVSLLDLLMLSNI